MSERSSAQANTPTSTNMQYAYPTTHFDHMNLPPIQPMPDMYSYYGQNVYPQFPSFDDHNQWGSADTTGTIQPGPIQFHPSMYAPSPLDMSRTSFDYTTATPHFPHYHHGFTTPFGAPPPSTGASGFDMSWNHQNLPMPQMSVASQQSMTPIGVGLPSNKKLPPYDEYPATGVSDILLTQQLRSVDLSSGSNHDETHAYDNGTHDNSVMLPSTEQHHHYPSTSSNLSLSSSRTSQPAQPSASSNGPKSYASVVSADTTNSNSNKSTPSVSNVTIRSSIQSSNFEHNTTNSNFPNDSENTRSYPNSRGGHNFNSMNNVTQQSRNGSAGYSSRDQQSSTSGGILNWTNNIHSSNTRGNNQNQNSSTFYNSGSSNYYNRSSYSQQQQQQPSASSNSVAHTNSKRGNQNYQQQNYGSSRTGNSKMSNGNSSSSNPGPHQMSAANQETLDSLKRKHQYNPTDFDLNPKGARFFVIKSYSEDDVHRSIKYNIWCSTEHGNKRLDTAFREREGKGPIYLFFSVNASGHFCGMAEMMSALDYENTTDVWQMSNKWQGKFEVKWIYVKDVPNQQFRHIRLENNDNKPVTNSRDTQEIPYEKGKLMLKTMHMFRDKTSIFDDFQYYESKQAEEVTKKPANTEQTHHNSTRGNYHKRQYSSNRTAAMHGDQEQQQHQQNQYEDNDYHDQE